mmetsp:Transcript_62955/g.130852  ORF Transcript_62955/g.130852 Transcript_62955/m.130852 type:complete len:252 (-) Transcript_62955:139-894(-)
MPKAPVVKTENRDEDDNDAGGSSARSVPYKKPTARSKSNKEKQAAGAKQAQGDDSVQVNREKAVKLPEYKVLTPIPRWVMNAFPSCFVKDGHLYVFSNKPSEWREQLLVWGMTWDKNAARNGATMISCEHIIKTDPPRCISFWQVKIALSVANGCLPPTVSELPNGALLFHNAYHIRAELATLQCTFDHDSEDWRMTCNRKWNVFGGPDNVPQEITAEKVLYAARFTCQMRPSDWSNLGVAGWPADHQPVA